MSICQKHVKHIEAFCSDDQQLLCINCILFEGHKGHSFQSIEQSVQEEYTKFALQGESVMANQQKVIKQLQSLSAADQQLDGDCTRACKDIQRYFTQLRTLIAEREQKLIETIQQIQAQQKNIFQSQILKAQQQLQDLNEFVSELSALQSKTKDPIAFLQEAPSRIKLLTKAQIQLAKVDLQIKLPELNKELEINNISKTILRLQQTQSSVSSAKVIKQPVQKKAAVPVQKKSSVKKVPLAEMVPNAVQINLKKKIEESKLQPIRLTNFQEARNQAKERNYDRSVERRRDQSTPRIKQIQAENNHRSAFEINNISHDESIKCEFQTFLNSVPDFDEQDYQLITIGGFVDNLRQIVETYSLKNDESREQDVFRNSRCKFGIAHMLNGSILLMGGKQDGIRLDSCEEYNYRDKQIQRSNIRLPSARSGFGVLNVNHLVYVIGGNDGSDNLQSVDIYNQMDQCWTKGQPLLESRDELALSMYDNCIFAIGGFGGQCNDSFNVDNTCLRTVEIYQNGKWCNGPPLNIPRRALAAVALPDGIYAIGGFDGAQYLNSVEKLEEHRWVLIKSMNNPRCTLSAVASPDCSSIYVLGGFDNGPLDTVEKYSIIEDQWIVTTPLLSKRFMHQTFISLI